MQAKGRCRTQSNYCLCCSVKAASPSLLEVRGAIRSIGNCSELLLWPGMRSQDATDRHANRPELYSRPDHCSTHSQKAVGLYHGDDIQDCFGAERHGSNICAQQPVWSRELTGTTKHGTGNLLLLQTAAESKLDSQHWTILPEDN